MATTAPTGLSAGRLGAYRGLTSPGTLRALMAAVAVLSLVTAACGQAPEPVLRSEAVTPAAPTTETASGSEQASILSPTEARAAQEAAGAAADAARSAGRERLTQGAGAMDPRTHGTVVAHAIMDVIVAYERPDRDSAVVSSFDNPTDRGGPLVFAGIGTPTDGWLEVMLPIRPNGSTGWIEVTGVDLTINPYRIEVDAAAHQLTILRYGREQLSTTVAIGTGDTPTPIGEFFLIELLRPSNPDGVYGPYAYGLSGYSETLESFNGGEGVIGIHGTNQPGLLGQDVSHGCIRVANPTISEMTEFLPLGTPVSIFRSDASEPATDGETDTDSV